MVQFLNFKIIYQLRGINLQTEKQKIQLKVA